MDASFQTNDLRSLVIDGFLRHGATEDDCHDLRETILIRDGFYYGRSFRTTRLMATMIVETGCVQFHTSSGQLLDSLAVPAAEAPATEAARKAA